MDEEVTGSRNRPPGPFSGGKFYETRRLLVLVKGLDQSKALRPFGIQPANLMLKARVLFVLNAEKPVRGFVLGVVSMNVNAMKGPG